MKVEITRHAAEQMERRRISLAWIEQALQDPDWTEPDPVDPGLTRAFRQIPAMENRVLRVVFSLPAPDLLRVVTAFFDRNAGLGRQHGKDPQHFDR